MKHITDKEYEILGLAAQIWNIYQKIEIQHPEEPRELSNAIHKIQDIVAVRVARSAEPKVFPKKR